MDRAIYNGEKYVLCPSIYLIFYFDEVIEVEFEVIYDDIPNHILLSYSFDFYSQFFR